MVPTLKTRNNRLCVLLDSNAMGLLRIEDAERLQVFALDLIDEGVAQACCRLASAASCILPASHSAEHSGLWTAALEAVQ